MGKSVQVTCRNKPWVQPFVWSTRTNSSKYEPFQFEPFCVPSVLKVRHSWTSFVNCLVEDAWLSIMCKVSLLKILMLLKNGPLEMEILWASRREILDFFIKLRKYTKTVVYLFHLIVGKNLSSLFRVILG